MVRNSSFELLRLLLMMMIVIHHCIVHGLGLTSLSPDWPTSSTIPASQMLAACSVNSFCICAVNCFILISGYFGIRTTKKRVFSIIAMLLFYTILLSVIPNLLSGNYKGAIMSCLFLSHTPYWFVLDYIFIMILAPFLNTGFERYSINKLRLIVMGLIAISCYFGFVWKHTANTNGYTLMQFILMYCIGRWIAKENISLSKWKSILLYLFGSALCAFLMYKLWQIGKGDLAWRMTYYNNPLLVISATGLFLLFKDIHFSSSKINYFAKSALAIYLIQSSPLVGQYLYDYIKDCSIRLNNVDIWLLILLLSASIVLLSILADQIRAAIFKILKL